METKRSSSSGNLTKAVAAYRGLAILLLNTVLVVLLLNALCAVMFAVRDARRGPTLSGPETRYAEKDLAAVYPEYTREDRVAMLRENWLRPYQYQEFVMFAEQPITGRFVNVTEIGFRKSKNQAAWPPSTTNFNLFVFGGSTTFGYGLPDDQTVPSYLQETLGQGLDRPLCVYNFAAGWYYSTQERIRFERLLTDGYRPHAVIFIDGVNDCDRLGDRPAFTDRFRKAFEEANERTSRGNWFDEFALGRAVQSLKSRLSPEKAGASEPGALNEDEKRWIGEALFKYKQNKQLIEAACDRFSIAPIFVWQPSPAYKYDLKYHRFSRPGAQRNEAYGYIDMARVAQSGELGPNFLWCADLQEEEKDCLYVDNRHYSGKFGRKLAEAISRLCTERDLLKPRKSVQFEDSSAPNQVTR